MAYISCAACMVYVSMLSLIYMCVMLGIICVYGAATGGEGFSLFIYDPFTAVQWCVKLLVPGWSLGCS